MIYKNITSIEEHETSGELHMALRVSMGIIAVLSILSNGLLIAVFLRNRSLLRSSYNVLILSLAVTDMTTGMWLNKSQAYFEFIADLIDLSSQISFICLLTGVNAIAKKISLEQTNTFSLDSSLRVVFQGEIRALTLHLSPKQTFRFYNFEIQY